MSTKKKQNNYPQTFKNEAVKLMVEQGYSAKEAAEAVNVPVAYLYKWRAQKEKEGQGLRLMGDEREELLRLRKENKRLKMEQDSLKKATAFFAKSVK